MEQERDFKGVWIPKEIWLDKRLNALDKIILAEIDSLDSSERGCWASNKHIAEFCQCSEAKVSKTVSKLIELGYIYLQKFDGRQRELKSCIVTNTNQPCKKYKADLKKVQESNTDNNTSNNTNKKESKKETAKSYDDIINAYTGNEELKYALIEFIKMRKVIKKPLSNKALELNCKTLDKLANNDDDKIEIVTRTIMNSWQGFYPLKNDSQQKQIKNNDYCIADNADKLDFWK